MQSTSYPSVRRDSGVVEAFESKARGVVQVPNPYHWLEDIDSAETKVEPHSTSCFVIFKREFLIWLTATQKTNP